MLHSVLCQKILQVNKPLQVTRESLAVLFLFYIFTILLVPCCSIVCMFIQDEGTVFFFFLHCATFIYSYIHTSCDVFWSTISQKQSRVSCIIMTKCVIVNLFIMSVCLTWGKHSLLVVLSEKKSLQVDRLPTNQHFHVELELHRNKNV